MKLSTLLRHEIEKRSIRTIKEAALLFGVSGELARRILNMGLIPKDATLVKIARSLEMDPSILITAGHRQKLPRELREQMLPVAPPSGGVWEQKRRWPLSQEQCDYLAREMKPHEIQLIRKTRQLAPDERKHLIAFIEYMFATQRVPPPATREPVRIPDFFHDSSPETTRSMECAENQNALNMEYAAAE